MGKVRYLKTLLVLAIAGFVLTQDSSSTLSTRKQSWHKTTKVLPKTLIAGLEHPWGMAWLPDGSMLITERPGRLRLVKNGQLLPTPIKGLPEIWRFKGQGGLLDVSIHPQFPQNRLIYLTYAYGTEEANRTRVARAFFDGETLRDVKVIFEVSQTKSGGQHFGSRITWLSDGTMLVSIGDGGNPPIQLAGDLIRKQAQNKRSHLGKIIRLNDDGTVPLDNPFVGDGDAEPQIWSYGHRNIQGLAFDSVRQRVWATEHGSRGGDELNLIEKGKNYGWPLVTYSQEYSGGEISQERSRPGMIDPKTVWTPAIAPSGLTVFNINKLNESQRAQFADWDGDVFAGGLVSKNIHKLDVDQTGKVIGEEVIAIGQRVRDVRQGPDGLLYVLTDEQQGQLMRLEPN